MFQKLLSPVALTCAFLLAFSAASHKGAQADDEDDAVEHEEARRALEQGLVRPLEEIILEARKHVQGDLIEVELEHEDGRYIYELELIQPSGQIIELQIDAKSMAVIEDD
ncbi:putative membrane protein YkoI [Mycoplana sp. BE70]|uniref:PepSY domain-containing protein n=1 Tax=Mycoplana sp. BE70 TaxID=2817775 RepID=UPI00285CB913|nr:PepSY domain-containing protein [Mycoplana sp. BE70]MDR6759375.1 putative membrane protein YkoI [Mycoplana sp. BE70]